MPRAEDDRGRKETRRPPAHLPSADLTYREIVDRTNAIVLRWDPDGRIIFMNDFGQRLFGYLEVEDLGRFQRHMAASAVNARWQADMGVLIDPLTDPTTGFHRQLDEVFHLG